MKKIVCEICEGTEFTKENGMFVCCGCGLHYTAEEVKKMIVEIEDDGSALQQSKVMDQRLVNLYTRARQSLEVDDLEHAAEYYKQILDEVPDDWEAYFYSYLGEFTSFTNAQAPDVANKLTNTIPTAYDMAIVDGNLAESGLRAVTISRKTAERLSGIAMCGASLLRQYEGGFALSAFGQVNTSMYRQLRPLAQAIILTCVLAFDALDAKVMEIYGTKHAIDESAFIECVLTLRRMQVQLANMTFSPTAGAHEILIKKEVLQSYTQRLEGTERYAATARQRIDAEKARKQWEERQERRNAYWSEHAAEKADWESKKQNLEDERVEIKQKVNELLEDINTLAAKRHDVLPEERQLRAQKDQVAALNEELRSLGVFKTQEKKALQQRISQESAVADELKRQVDRKKEEHVRQIEGAVAELNEELAGLRVRLQKIDQAVRAIDAELNADR